MNNGNTDTSPAERPAGATRTSRSAATQDELNRLKDELMRTEVRLAKARAAAVGAEIDLKVLHAQLKALTP